MTDLASYGELAEVRALATSLTKLISLSLHYSLAADAAFDQGLREGLAGFLDDTETVYTLASLHEEISRSISAQEIQRESRICEGIGCGSLAPYPWHVGFTLAYVTLLVEVGRTPFPVSAPIHQGTFLA